MKVDRTANIVELLTLVAVVLGGIAGYVFVQRHQANESQANAALAQMQQELADIEGKIGNVVLSVDVSDFISEIQPNLQISLQPDFDVAGKSVTLTWQLTNHGKYAVVVERPRFGMSPKVINESSAADSLLVEGKDFDLLFRARVGEVPPGQTLLHDLTIQFPEKLPARVYFASSWEAKLDPAVQSIAKVALTKHLESEGAVEALATKRFGVNGWLKIK
jgi:hypothetical protein